MASIHLLCPEELTLHN
uniref:Uncharacterized protein n=1 Tax=Anguilla anguilla TaxID=7936 RepID=A0A0E9UUA6_ANGAN